MTTVWVQLLGFVFREEETITGMYSGGKQSSCFYAHFAAGSLQIPAASVQLFEANSSIYESKSYCLKKTKTKVGRVYIFAPVDPRGGIKVSCFFPFLFPTSEDRIGQTRNYCSDLIKSRRGTSLFKGSLSASDGVNSLRNSCNSLPSLHTRPPSLSTCSATANLTLNNSTKLNLLVSPLRPCWKSGHQQLQIENFCILFFKSEQVASWGNQRLSCNLSPQAEKAWKPIIWQGTTSGLKQFSLSGTIWCWWCQSHTLQQVPSHVLCPSVTFF